MRSVCIVETLGIALVLGTSLLLSFPGRCVSQTATTSQSNVASNRQTSDAPSKQFVAAQSDDIKTGPNVGEIVPAFTLPDQYGKPHSLHDLMGREGLLLVFIRTADW
jgi:hypothetical protein